MEYTSAQKRNHRRNRNRSFNKEKKLVSNQQPDLLFKSERHYHGLDQYGKISFTRYKMDDCFMIHKYVYHSQ